jgi:hypothetical protein
MLLVLAKVVATAITALVLTKKPKSIASQSEDEATRTKGKEIHLLFP